MDSFWCIQSLMSACFKLEKKFIIYACLSKDQQVFIIIDSNRSTSVQINWCIISYPKLKFNEMFIVNQSSFRRESVLVSCILNIVGHMVQWS